MDVGTYVMQLEREWSHEPDCFFGDLKRGFFNEHGFERVKQILDSLRLEQEDVLNKRFVEVTWFIPTFMRWQQDGWRQDGKDTQQLNEAIKFVEMRLTTILGLP